MSSDVFFCPLDSRSSDDKRADAGKKILQKMYESGKIVLPASLPIKVHFGEKGNRTYLKPEVYNGMIEFLKSCGSSAFFTETSVLYGGERFEAAKHIALAQTHGFTAIPVVIADGERGEKAVNVPLKNGRHFKSAAVAELLANAEQVLVVSHFKGHILAGFGGALKQLSMGFAAKGGKMAMHLTVTPKIKQLKCKVCKLCMTRCSVNAIGLNNGKLFIDREKCLGCGACFAICPQKAISVFSFAGLKNMLFGKKIFREKLMEYAYAGHHGKKNIYVSFVVDVTGGCDCEPRRMSPCIPDVGVFASLDPVALDAACYDAVAASGKRFSGFEQLVYAEKIGVGTTEYHLIEV